VQQAGSLFLPRSSVGVVALALSAAVLSAAIGALPLPAAAGLAVGIPLLVLTVAVPRVAILLLLLSVPFQSWTKVSLGPYDVTATDALVGILMSTWVLRCIVDRRIPLSFGATIVAACVLAAAELLSALTATSFPSAAKEIIKIAELIAVALFAVENLRGEDDLRFVVWSLLGAGLCEALVGLFQFVTGRGPASFAIGPFIRAYGDFDQPNAFAGYLAIILPFGAMFAIFSGRHKGIAALATGVLGLALLASMSRGAWLGVMCGFGVMALVWSPRARRALPIAGLLLLALFPAARLGLLPRSIADRISVILENYWLFDARTAYVDPGNWSIVERMANWQAAWSMAMDHPLVGIGPGNYSFVYPDYYIGMWAEILPHAHNLYLNMFAEAGILGLVAFLAFTITPFVVLTKGLRLSGATSWAATRMSAPSLLLRRAFLVAVLGSATTFAIHNTFDNMLIHGIGVQFGLILGLLEAQVAVLRPPDEPSLSAAGDALRAED
jgi:O-antigen ligase